jgi:biotin/methionine sulfoxide reductase
VLPATTTRERNDIGAGSRDRWLLAMHQAIEPVGEARSDFAIFSEIAARVGTFDAFTEGRDERAWLEHLYNVTRQLAARRAVELPSFAEFWETGHVEIPAPREPYVMFGDFRAAPDERPLNTPSGRIEIFSERIAGFAYDDCPGHPTWLEPVEWLGSVKARAWPLHLISNQPRTRLHGQLDNGGVSRASKIKGREPVWLNPADAAARNIADGDVVRVFNERGATLAGAVVTDLVMPGVTQLATGAWYDPVEPGRPEALDKHGNPNTLTLDKGTSRLGQGPIAHSALVEVERFEGEPPPITAWDAPPA